MSNKPRTVRAIKARVYSRVVGYYTAVDDWNKGKQEEFRDRHSMTPQELGFSSPVPPIAQPVCEGSIYKAG